MIHLTTCNSVSMSIIGDRILAIMHTAVEFEIVSG